MVSVLPCSSVASAVAPPQLKEFLTSIEWESKDEAFVDAVIQELAENDIMVPGTPPCPRLWVVLPFRTGCVPIVPRRCRGPDVDSIRWQEGVRKEGNEESSNTARWHRRRCSHPS